MSDPCPNCAKLEAELETLRDEFKNGVAVLDKREENSRAEVAELKRELGNVYAGLKLAAEEAAARVQELLAKP